MISPSNKEVQYTAPSWIIYDSECPFCRNYVSLIRLRKAIGNVDLISAREANHRVKEAQAKGFDLNEGMVFYYEGRYHYGADAINMMALMSTPSTIFNRINRWFFTSPKIAKIFYPALRGCRNITLKILGVTKITLS